MNLWKARFQSTYQVKKILKRQVGMQPADDVKFGHGFAITRGRGLPGFFERHGVGTRTVLLASEGAQATSSNANIRWIDMSVNVEIADVAIHPLTHQVSQPADSQD